MIDVDTMRHPKEQVYFGAAAVVGGIIWLILLVISVGTILIWAIPIAIIAWVSEQFFKAQIFGNSVRISESQYPEIYDLVQECSRSLELSKIPEVFVINSSGTTNAMAVRFLSKKYVLLYSELIDLMILNRENMDELKMLIGHELAHHAAGHVNPLKRLLMMPAMFIPFLGNAYSRACELTADRIGAAFTQDAEASKRALLALACGSDALVSKTDIEAFKQQERNVPSIAGFISELYSSHPRMTIRIMELEKAESRIS